MLTTFIRASRHQSATVAFGCLAAVAAPSWAQQGALTIYGIVDMGIAKSNDGTTPGSRLNGAGPADDWVVKAGNTSRIGFRASEDLGDGKYARFQIEHRFAMDTGTSSNANVFWLGRSVVALGSKSLGEVYAGREYSPAYWVALNVDPTAWSYVSQTGAAYTYANYTPVATSVEASNIRWANSVGYKSPQLGPVTFEASTGLGEGRRKRSEAANVQVKLGKLWGGLAYDGLDGDTNMALVGATYDLGFVRPSASFTTVKGGVNGAAKSLTFSALVPTGFGRVYGSFAELRPANGSDSRFMSGGAQYDLSKRTLIYGNVGSAKQVAQTRLTAFDFGMKHTF
ncbi:porin [Rhizobacter sp. LjRoot28]|uniref:porin n=1 Tax=Rhizobacter sp. LjRoot28 TaxID=3342309 RepID=UPI003ED100C1